MKHAFTDPSKVINLWLNQSQGRANTRNIFFEGTSIYSYGYHYKLGKLIYGKNE